MQRVYGVVEDEIVHRIDEAAGERGISRAQWIRDSILAYLHRGSEDLEREVVRLQTLCGEQAEEITALKEALAVKDGELVRLREVEARYKEIVAEANQRWEEIKILKSELARAKRELDEARGDAEKLRSEAERIASELAAAQREALLARSGEERALSALKAKEDEVAFLRSHLAQLTQSISQLALKPGDEGKRWWRFWR